MRRVCLNPSASPCTRKATDDVKRASSKFQHGGPTSFDVTRSLANLTYSVCYQDVTASLSFFSSNYLWYKSSHHVVSPLCVPTRRRSQPSSCLCRPYTASSWPAAYSPDHPPRRVCPKWQPWTARRLMEAGRWRGLLNAGIGRELLVAGAREDLLGHILLVELDELLHC